MAVIVEEHVRRVAKSHEQVDAAVVVEIDPRDLPRLSLDVDAEVASDLCEFPAVALVAIQLIGSA